MNKEMRDRLERAGFRVGDAEDFLELNEEERELVKLRLLVSRAVRRCRELAGFTQKQLASRIRSSQSRVAKIEAGAADVSLDLSFRALFAAGGHLDDLEEKRHRVRDKVRQAVHRVSQRKQRESTHKEDLVETGERHG